MKKNVGKVATFAVLTWAMSLPLAAYADDPPIVIGMAIAETGWMVQVDGDASNSVRLWIEEQNAKGGLLGRQLKEITVDTKTDRAEAARAGQAVVDQGADLVVVSCDYDEGAPAAAAAQRANKMSLYLCAGDPKAGVQGTGPYAFTAGMAAQVEGAAIAEWAQKKLGVKKVYTLLDTNYEYNKSVCAGWDWQVKNIGLEEIGKDTFKNDDPSIQSQITRINGLAEKPDAIMLCSINPGGGSAIRQLRAAGIETPILGGAGMDGSYWLDAVPGLSKYFISVQASVYGDDPDAEVNTWAKNFAAKFGHAPVSALAIPSYVTLGMWAKAVEAAGTTDPAKIVPLMEQYKDEPTIIGPRTFTNQLHIQDQAELRIVEYDGGKPKYVDSLRISQPVPFDVLFRLK